MFNKNVRGASKQVKLLYKTTSYCKTVMQHVQQIKYFETFNLGTIVARVSMNQQILVFRVGKPVIITTER